MAQPRVVWRYFSREEVQCKCGCKAWGMDQAFMAKLDRLREAVQRPLIVSSGFRCPAHNDRVSSTGRSGPHTTGHAIDLAVQGQLAFLIVGLAPSLGFRGIGVSQKGAHQSRFIHLDDLGPGVGRPRPWIWSY